MRRSKCKALSPPYLTRVWLSADAIDDRAAYPHCLLLFRDGTFALAFDFHEPEAALSPNRQFDFLKILARMEAGNQTQVLIVTHAPIIMAYPGARLLRMGRHGLEQVALQDNEHFRIMRDFVGDPDGMIRAMIEG